MEGKMKNRKRTKNVFFSEIGFTLVEILVVVTIIGILAGIVMINVSMAAPTGRDGRRQADIKQIEAACEQYFSDYRKFPTSIDVLVSGDYLKELPKDPKNVAPYTYTYDKNPATCDNAGNGNCSEYCTYAKLERNPKSGEGYYKDSTGTNYYFLVCSTYSYRTTFIGTKNWSPN